MMTKLVCFIDDDGQVGTCINDNEGDCAHCAHNDDAHKKWSAEIEKNRHEGSSWSEFKGKYTLPADETDSHLLKSIKTHNVSLHLNFIDQDIIIYGEASTDGIEVSGITRCFSDDLHCEDCDGLKCPYIDKSKEQAIFDKWEEPVAELMREIYKKIEAQR